MQVSPARSAEDLSPLEIFPKSYIDEWGKPPASDPNASPTRWPTTLLPPQPETIPPYPFTEWPFGGASTIGATVPNSQGGALMKALAPTDFGKWLKDNHIEIYGWINGGGNISTTTDPKKNANFAAAYMYSADILYFDDLNGQRTGFKTAYFNYAIGWQHWFSPSVTFRPEVAWYSSLDTKAFDNGKR